MFLAGKIGYSMDISPPVLLSAYSISPSVNMHISGESSLAMILEVHQHLLSTSYIRLELALKKKICSIGRVMKLTDGAHHLLIDGLISFLLYLSTSLSANTSQCVLKLLFKLDKCHADRLILVQR